MVQTILVGGKEGPSETLEPDENHFIHSCLVKVREDTNQGGDYLTRNGGKMA